VPRITAINQYLQKRLLSEDLNEVAAVEAAEWLDQSGLLRDTATRPGKPCESARNNDPRERVVGAER
jgi:hypothetical protein